MLRCFCFSLVFTYMWAKINICNQSEIPSFFYHHKNKQRKPWFWLQDKRIFLPLNSFYLHPFLNLKQTLEEFVILEYKAFSKGKLNFTTSVQYFICSQARTEKYWLGKVKNLRLGIETSLMNMSVSRTYIPQNMKDLFLSNVSIRIVGIHGCLYLIMQQNTCYSFVLKKKK